VCHLFKKHSKAANFYFFQKFISLSLSLFQTYGAKVPARKYSSIKMYGGKTPLILKPNITVMLMMNLTDVE
jgi:hypothetical protein